MTERPERTPVTKQAIGRVMTGDPVAQVIKAWTEPGVRPAFHEAMKSRLRRQMPVLGAALDRLAAERTVADVADPPQPRNRRSTDPR